MSRDVPSCVAVIGLGYAGLPLAVAFGDRLPTIGFDINPCRVRELSGGLDRNGDLPPEALRAPHLTLTADPAELPRADFFIVAVPTPVDKAKRPDLRHVILASQLVGRALRSRSEKPPSANHPPVVVYESTVYPGCTEGVCIPVLQEESGLVAGQDFKVGYSPERINPGDPEHTLQTIVKVVGGQDKETTELMARVYSLVVKAGVHRAPDIRTAEAAKVIENIQRDLNIALMNELAMLCHRLGLDTREILKAARTKWNFLPFEPGLVGGHCIPVDPYYLAHKAQETGYHPEVILTARRINDLMGIYVAQQTMKLLIRAGKVVQGARVLVLGVTFKENVPDLRNTRVVELAEELVEHGVEVAVHDPLVSADELRHLGLTDAKGPFDSTEAYDGVVVAVPHRAFRERSWEDFVQLLGEPPGVLIDVKGMFSKEQVGQGVLYWSL